MPETYTGDEGDVALAAGLSIMDGGEAASDIDLAINKTRDMIAERTAAITPVVAGGTGADTALGARFNLGTDNAANLTTGTLPAERLPNHNHSISGTNGVTGLQAALDDKADKSYVDNRVAASPSSPQPLYNPYGRSNPVATSWVSAALDVNGRLGIQPSSIRFKNVLGEFEGSTLELRPVVYTLKADENGDERAGFIAEEVADHLPAGVVLDDEGVPLALQLDAIVAALVGDVQRLTARVAELEGGVT